MSLELTAEFERIRDIPYSIPLSASEENFSCSGKAVMLKNVLDTAGVESRFRVCDFRWSDLPIPEEILAIPHDDLSTHVYLEVNVGGEWVNVDPSWDSGLSSSFATSEWDGKTSTPIAVAPLTLHTHEESDRIMTDPSQAEDAAELERNREFYAALNQWFAKKRSKTI